MKKINEKYLASCIWIFCSTEAMAQQISRPSFVNDVDVSRVGEAGASLNTWILAIIAVVIGIACLFPAWHFFNGNTEKAIDLSKNILYGVLSVTLLGAVAFGLITILN